MRRLPYITIKKVLEELKHEVPADYLKELQEEESPISRVTFYRLIERYNLPHIKRPSGKVQWRVFTREQANYAKETIKREYLLLPPSEAN
jgi:hypothetical protein